MAFNICDGELSQYSGKSKDVIIPDIVTKISIAALPEKGFSLRRKPFFVWGKTLRPSRFPDFMMVQHSWAEHHN